MQLKVDGKNTMLDRFPLNQLEEVGKFVEEMRQNIMENMQVKHKNGSC